jgi:tRNA threonylcarbamoyladenosine biosynthesis protein TsaE
MSYPTLQLSATPLLRQIGSMSAAAATRSMELPNLAATETLATSVAALTRPGDVILLEGELGAGKTAFARAFLRAATGDPALEVPSPTFTLVQSYDTPIGVVHHFDLWRLEGPSGLMELGWADACADIVLVEWPDRLGLLRPAAALTVALHLTGADSRRIVLSGWSDRLGRIL